MAYLSLYRRYRPQTFAQVVGQDHVTRTLANAITEDRLHHAYLFTGPRGTGKTSTARILAKAINCEQGPTMDPCNACAMCTEITEGSSVDVIELDMASHGGVDDARELRDRAMFGPARARRKVYILDEVHMASTAAFNALLKLVEEPPPHVLFAMATTDPQKVLPTILSRVQRLDLRRVDAEILAAQVRRIADAEGSQLDDEAVEVIVRAGDGSVRDTLSVLEQILAHSPGEVGGAVVAEILGITPHDRASQVLDLVVAGDIAGVLVAVQTLVDDGYDLRRFTFDLAQHVRDLLALAVVPDRPDLVEGTRARRQRLSQQASVVPVERLLRIIRVLADVAGEQRQGAPRLALELALSTLAVEAAAGRPSADSPANVNTAASQAVEQVVADQQEPQRQPEPSSDPDPQTGPDPRSDPDPRSGLEGEPVLQEPVEEQSPLVQEEPEAPAPSVVLSDGEPQAPTPSDASLDGAAAGTGQLEQVRDRWDEVLESVKAKSRRAHAVFEPATVLRATDGILALRYGKRYVSFHAAQAQRSELAELLVEALAEVCGQRFRLEVVREGDDERRRPRPADITPPDARTPVIDAPPREEVSSRDTEAPPDDEVDAVREAESQPTAPVADLDGLLARELGAERVADESSGD